MKTEKVSENCIGLASLQLRRLISFDAPEAPCEPLKKKQGATYTRRVPY
jgi:hypothetical protein